MTLWLIENHVEKWHSNWLPRSGHRCLFTRTGRGWANATTTAHNLIVLFVLDFVNVNTDNTGCWPGWHWLLARTTNRRFDLLPLVVTWHCWRRCVVRVFLVLGATRVQQILLVEDVLALLEWQRLARVLLLWHKNFWQWQRWVIAIEKKLNYYIHYQYFIY